MVTREQVLEALKEVYDPEIPVNIVDLGLVYGVEVDEENRVKIKMTLTAPGCPMAYYLIEQVEEVVRNRLPEVKDIHVELVWDPPWTPDRMSEEAKRLLGFT